MFQIKGVNVGTYNLTAEELKEEIKEFIKQIEGDFKLEDFVRASEIAYRELELAKFYRCRRCDKGGLNKK